MTLRCPVPRCAATNDPDAQTCLHCGTLLSAYARMAGQSARLFNAGLTAATAGHLTEARDLFAAVVHWCPGEGDARNALAFACHQLGDADQARLHWREVLTRRPADVFAAAGLRALDAEAHTPQPAPRRTT